MARFDFGTTPSSDEEQAATLKDLLLEINEEDKDIRETDVELPHLLAVRNLIHQVADQKLDSLVELLPLSTLKTVKLLYRKNQVYKGHFFQLLAPPSKGQRPSFEFSTTGYSPTDPKAAMAISALLEEIRGEIDPGKLWWIHYVLPPYAETLAQLNGDHGEVLEPLLQAKRNDAVKVAKAYRWLAGEIRAFKPADEVLTSVTHLRHLSSLAPVSMGERIYTYLRTLGFIHFVRERQALIEVARIPDPVLPIGEKVDAFCAGLKQGSGVKVYRDDAALSLNDFSGFAEDHEKSLRELIKSATGLSTRKDAFARIVSHAGKVLNLYLIHSKKKATVDETHEQRALSVMDCLAAICAIRHQVDAKTPYEAYWLGAGQQPSNALNTLDIEKTVREAYETDYIPHGVCQFLYSRFSEFHMALIGNSERHHAWVDLQTELFGKYEECMSASSISIIMSNLLSFRTHFVSSVGRAVLLPG